MPQPEYLQFGGMAVPEGVMMRSPNHYSVACRAPNGQIVVMTEPIEKTWIGRQKWLKKPFLRGTLALLDTMALGLKAMNWASNIQLLDQYQPKPTEPEAPAENELTPTAGKKGKKGKQKSAKTEKVMNAMVVGITLLVSLALGFLIFDASPEAIAQFTKSKTGITNTSTSYLAEVVKVILFIAYLSLIRLIPSIKEVFRYHGAEHKSINVIEAKQELTFDNCMANTRLHPRCGTNFAIVVLIVSFLLFPLIPRDFLVGTAAPNFLVVLARLGIKLSLLPVVAGVSYEIIRLAGKCKNQAWVNILLKPGLATQLITTAEPEAKHIEVGMASLKCAMDAEAGNGLTNTDDFRWPTDEPEPVAVDA